MNMRAEPSAAPYDASRRWCAVTLAEGMMKKWIIRIAVMLLLVVGTGGAYFYAAIWRPFQQMYRNQAWWDTATTDEQRLLCHRVISHRIGTPHDAFLHLRKIGNKDSVPLLIRALRWQRPPKDGVMVCTTAHCIDALRSLTGQDFGTDYLKWEQWWSTTGQTLSSTNCHQRAANQASEATSEPAPGAASSSPQG